MKLERKDVGWKDGKIKKEFSNIFSLLGIQRLEWKRTGLKSIKWRGKRLCKEGEEYEREMDNEGGKENGREK